MNTNAVLKLARLAQEMATRLERIGVDADGAPDPADMKRIEEIRPQPDLVMTHPTTKAIKKVGAL
jgi:hypothetical protein